MRRQPERHSPCFRGRSRNLARRCFRLRPPVSLLVSSLVSSHLAGRRCCPGWPRSCARPLFVFPPGSTSAPGSPPEKATQLPSARSAPAPEVLIGLFLTKLRPKRQGAREVESRRATCAVEVP